MPFLENPLIPVVFDTETILPIAKVWLLSDFNHNVCAAEVRNELVLKSERVSDTLLDPSQWSPPWEFFSKTQEVREAIDCPWEDHSRLPAASDILLRLSGPR